MTITLPGKGKVPAWLRFVFLDGPRAFGRGVWRHPKLWLLLLLGVPLSVTLGRNAGYTVYALILLPVWRVAKPASFRRWVCVPLRQDYRRCWRYDRRWANVMKERGLAIVRRGTLDARPDLVRVRCDEHGDTLWIRSLIGKDIEDWQELAPRIASDFGARAGRAYPGPLEQPWWRFWELRFDVRLELAYGPDPLAETIPALPIPESADDIDFSAVPVGLTERGDVWTVDLSLHVLVVGQTGSGKSGVLQQLLRSLAPAIQEGTVVVWGIDPKEGMEFRDISKVFDRYEDRGFIEMSAMLGDAVTKMRRQMRDLAGESLRKNKPTKERPLVLIVIDEMIDLTDTKGKPKDLWTQIHANLGELLRKGRAGGVIVFAAVTDPRVSEFPFRRAFPTKIGARLASEDETDMILGSGVRRRGAACHEIPESLPGMCYALERGAQNAQRVRAAYVTDEQIREMAAEYAPGEHLSVEDEAQLHADQPGTTKGNENA